LYFVSMVYFIYMGVSVTRRVNVVVVNSRNIIFRIFNRQ